MAATRTRRRSASAGGPNGPRPTRQADVSNAVLETPARALKAVDLFSGAGGLTEGLRLAGFRVLGAVENDALAAETYRVNHPGVRLWERDIRALHPREVLAGLDLEPGELDLLAGCPPCQGFSHLRTLNRSRPVEDDRNDLVLDYVRFVRELQPAAVLMENVPALAADPRMDLLVMGLEQLGYPAGQGHRVLNAADYGVPQRRRRLVLMVSRRGRLLADPSSWARTTVRDAIGWLPVPGRSGDPLHDLPERRSEEVLALIRSIPPDGGGRLDLGPERQLNCHRKTDGFKDVYGRLAWNRVAPTITSGCVNPSKGRFLHPEQDRAITLREAALLQSFRPDYWFSLSRGKLAAAAMIGNALPPAFAAAQARVIRSHLLEGTRR
jgi:DNA (cytosine-5)-methyltransferase 1